MISLFGGAIAAAVALLPTAVVGAPTVTVTEGSTSSGLVSFAFNIDPNDLMGEYDTVAADTTRGGGLFSDSENPFGISELNQVGEPSAAPVEGDSGIFPVVSLFAGSIRRRPSRVR